MANSNSLFKDFHEEIKIGSVKNDKMMESKNKLRKRIRKWFKENQPDYVPKFYIQGSYKMNSAIRTKEDICDLDDGIYFFREPGVSATTMQQWIHEAVNGYTSTTPEHRKKCVRSIFTSDYEIDHPVYYKTDDTEYRIAIKNTGWEDSDPKAVVNWFNKKKDANGRLIRSIKSMKVWCDNKDYKMPSGLAMTILASNAIDSIVLNERDDITLRDILKEIKKELQRKFQCIVPAVPNDDLFADYDDDRRNKFMDALSAFLNDAEEALREKNQLKASKLWRKHLGNRFPFGEDKDEQSTSSSSIGIGAASSIPYGHE